MKSGVFELSENNASNNFRIDSKADLALAEYEGEKTSDVAIQS